VSKRRQVLHLAILAAGASLFPSACRAINSTVTENKVTVQSSALTPPQTSKVVLVYNEDRLAGTRQALELLQPTGLKEKTAFLKPNYNTGYPAPAATDSQLLETLIQEFQGAQ
jgi:hypothetical protein